MINGDTKLYFAINRYDDVDASWAPWWKAQAEAITHVANLEEPNEKKKSLYLERAYKFVKELEEK